jgi:hypothetical protein
MTGNNKSFIQCQYFTSCKNPQFRLWSNQHWRLSNMTIVIHDQRGCHVFHKNAHVCLASAVQYIAKNPPNVFHLLLSMVQTILYEYARHEYVSSIIFFRFFVVWCSLYCIVIRVHRTIYILSCFYPFSRDTGVYRCVASRSYNTYSRYDNTYNRLDNTYSR